MTGPRPLREAALALAGALLLLAVFFAPAVFGGKVLYSGDFSGSDLLEMNVPRRVLAAEAVRQGGLPHWTPLLGNGMPLLAEGQAGVFYPPNLPLFLALSPAAASNLSILAALLVALLGAYALARTHGLPPGAAALAALSFALGGVMIFRLKHLNMIQVIAWLPVALLCVERMARGRAWALALALAAVLALQLLAGHPHAAVLCFLGTLLYAAVRPGRKTARLLGAFALAGVLAAVQLLPTAELVGLSLRGRAFDWESAAAYPFRPADLVRFVSPFFHGNPADASLPLERIAETGVFWESAPYLGLLPLVLALAAPFLRRDRLTFGLAGAAVLCLALALGRSGGLYWLLWKFVPGFDLFRFPSRFLIPFAAFATLLAGVGADAVLRRLPRPHLVAAALVLLTAADLYRVNSAYQGYLSPEWFTPPSTVDVARDGRVSSPTADQSWQRVYLMARGWRGDTDLLVAHRETLAPDASALHGVAQHSDHVLQEGGIELLRYATLQKAFRQAMAPVGDSLVLSPAALRILEYQNVTTLLSFFPLDGEGLRLVEARGVHSRLPGPLHLYRTANPVPRVRIVGRAVAAGSESEALARLASGPLDPAREVLLDGSPAEDSGGEGTAAVVSDEGSRLTIRAQAPEGGYLVLLDNWHPAWTAAIDGAPAPVLRADFAFRAVRLPPGAHDVVFRYDSKAFDVGRGISLLGWVAWALALAWKARSPGPPDGRNAGATPESPRPPEGSTGSPEVRKGRKKR